VKRIKTDKIVAHPLEEEFNIQPLTTVEQTMVVVPDEIIQLPDYDEKDNEIENKLEEIYSVAMGQVMIVADEIERVEGKYKARMGEVTATMLNVALGAVKEKTVLKVHKDKLMVEKTNTAAQRANGGTVNNNLVVTADRNEILQMLMKQRNPTGTDNE
jgi:hypothetical protein